MQGEQKDVLQTLQSLSGEITTAEESCLKRVTAIAEQANSVKVDIHQKTTTIRKFLTSANDGITAVKTAVSSLSRDLELLMTAIGPLEEALSRMRLKKNASELRVFRETQEAMLEAESQRHKTALQDIRQQRLAQMIEEDLKKAQELSTSDKLDRKQVGRRQNEPQTQGEVNVPVAMKKDLEDFLGD